MLAVTLEHLDVARVAPGLWIGSAPPVGPTVAHQGFQVVVLCAEEYQPRSWELPGVRVVHAGFNDTPFPTADDEAAAVGAARLTARALLQKRRVLVTCWQGRNRSGLVCAAALCSVYGWDARVARDAVRAVRPNALTNPTFQRMIGSIAR